jgi:predicted nucleic acid-binding protein
VAGKPNGARVYLDTAPVISVIKREDGLWQDGMKVLLAMDRGDIQVIASTLMLVELVGYKGDIPAGAQDGMIEKFLRQSKIQWVEVDLSIAREARELAKTHRLRGPDATHLATAVRHDADYFMSRDAKFPYGQRIGMTKIMKPGVVWNQTIDDLEVDAQGDPSAEQAADQKAP